MIWELWKSTAFAGEDNCYGYKMLSWHIVMGLDNFLNTTGLDYPDLSNLKLAVIHTASTASELFNGKSPKLSEIFTA